MRMEELYYLVDLAKTKSINRTAERIHVSQPAISKSLNKLEDELGVKLFSRSHQGVFLTEAGEIAVEMANGIIKEIDEYKLKLKIHLDNSSILSGNLSVYAVPAISNGILPEILTDFCKAFPNVIVTEKDQEVPNILEDVKAGKADIGIIRIVEGLIKIDENEFYLEKLIQDKLLVCTSKLSSLAKKKSVSMKELSKYPIIVYYSDSFIKYFLKDTDNAKVTLNSNNFSIFKKSVTEGLAAGIITKFMADSALKKDFNAKEIMMVPISDDINIAYGWIRSRKYPFSKPAQEFIKMLKSQCYF
ncbi:MAG: LysR family transcriptional regulator [Dehalobacterium sp.]